MDTLKKAFDTEAFKKTGISLIDYISDAHENAENRKVIPYVSPEEQYHYWKKSFGEKGEPLDLFKDVIQHSVYYQHPNYMGHQTAIPAMSGVLASLVTDYLNNAMGVYEMGIVGNIMERIIAEHLCEKFKLGNKSGGFFTSGGTLGTLTALLTAKAHYVNCTLKDETENDNLCIMVSEQAHYCIERAVLTMGLGQKGIIKIPVNKEFQIRTDLLEEYYQKAISEGKKVFCIVGSAPSTSTGAYENLEDIANFCHQKNIWLHVDGAHGACVIFSSKYKHLVKGIENADSIVMDFHKMMLTPSTCTAVLLKNRTYAYDTYKQKADYLWQKQNFEWYHGGKSTFECTKSMYILKVFVLFKQFGDSIFEQYVENQYNLTGDFAKLIQQHPQFELACTPQSNIICFRYIDCKNPNQFNELLREKIVMEGLFYLVQTRLNDKIYLRTTLMNPQTTIENIKNLMSLIVEKADLLK